MCRKRGAKRKDNCRKGDRLAKARESGCCKLGRYSFFPLSPAEIDLPYSANNMIDFTVSWLVFEKQEVPLKRLKEIPCFKKPERASTSLEDKKKSRKPDNPNFGLKKSLEQTLGQISLL